MPRAPSAVLAVVLLACSVPPSAAHPSPAPPREAPSSPPRDAADVAAAPILDAAPAPIPDASSSPDAALSLSDRAAACLDDPSCPAATADDLFRAADDASEPAVDCFRFADGDGTRRDLSAGRACHARDVASGGCEGSSAGLGRAELAIMLVDGAGGPVDIAGARALFADCFDDVTKQEVFEHAAAREAKPTTSPVSFCKDYGGTTLTGNECAFRMRQQEETRGALQAKRIVAGMDDEGRALFVGASKAYRAYVEAMGAYVYEVFRDGTIRNGAALAEEQSLLHRRTEELAHLSTFALRAVSQGALERSERSVDAALKARRARAGTKEVAQRIDEAQAAWRIYRGAEIALYLRVLAGRASREVVEGATSAALDARRVGDLRTDSGDH